MSSSFQSAGEKIRVLNLQGALNISALQISNYVMHNSKDLQDVYVTTLSE